MNKIIDKKRFWKLFIPFLILLIVVILILNGLWTKNFKFFSTPEEAVYGYEGGKKGIEYLSVIENDNLGIAFYKKDGELVNIKVEVKNNMWKVVTNESIFVFSTMKKIKNYNMATGYCNKKYYVWISANDSFANISEPSDSLNSTFMKNIIQDGGYTSYDWFLVLDEKPENYSVTVDGEIVQITE